MNSSSRNYLSDSVSMSKLLYGSVGDRSRTLQGGVQGHNNPAGISLNRQRSPILGPESLIALLLISVRSEVIFGRQKRKCDFYDRTPPCRRKNQKHEQNK